jgi:hypothetical protein
MKEWSNGAAAMAAAAFVVEALGLAEQPGELTEDLVLVEDALPATTMAVELDSADGRLRSSSTSTTWGSRAKPA